MRDLEDDAIIICMRFTLAAHPTARPLHDWQPMPLDVHLRPMHIGSGRYVYTTDSRELLTMLKRNELSGGVLEPFIKQLRLGSLASLSRIELKDSSLREIGYFLD